MSIQDVFLIIGAIATSVIAIIALFHDVIKEYINIPKLRFEIEYSPPHCHRVITEGGNFVYYFALKMWNDGKNKAENVEVTLNDVFKKVGDKWERISGFNPDNLLWRLTGDPYLPFLNPGTPKQCNIGYIIDPKIRTDSKLSHLMKYENNPNLNVNPDETIFHIQVSMQSTNLTYLIAPGTYKFRLSASCSNGKTAYQEYKIKITGKWFEDEERMLNEGINISEI